jgi:hypothetical protein
MPFLMSSFLSDSSAEGRSSQTESYGKKNEASDVDKAFDELMAG